ncbi:DUF58 domain-containing protein [Hyphobacterium sp. CCMP332]|nr:DUF58 domain-containing protein [Hyphobacterium sp. CCMP332]
MQLDFERIRTYENIELLARQLVEGFITGLHKSPYHGFSVEFAEHRLYNSGESTRFIDWRVYSRTDKLYVKKFEEETNLRCQILIDNSSSMYFPVENLGKITFSTTAAAALTILLNRQRDAVGLTLFSDFIEEETDSKANRRHQHEILVMLQRLLKQEKSNKKTNISEVLHHTAEKAKPRSLIIIFSDFLAEFDNMSELFNALSHLRYKQHEVIVFDVFDKEKELELDYNKGFYNFTDLESGVKLKLNPIELRKSYINRITEIKANLKDNCARNKIDYFECNINEDMYKILNSFLIKRAKMI